MNMHYTNGVVENNITEFHTIRCSQDNDPDTCRSKRVYPKVSGLSHNEI
jgi:hypothetical protein